jgi:DNA polymerase III epsilon subunit-like protein
MILACDVETSGLVIKDRPLSDPAQPRIVQLGFVVHTADRREIHTYRTLIQPDGWEIAKEAASVHGFTTEDCARYGVPPKVALLNLVSMLATVRVVVCHNLAFEAALLQRELDLLKAADQAMRRPRLRRVCSMKASTALMSDGRYPSLSKIYRILTGREFTEAHDALEDARATMDVFWALVDRRVIEL